MNPLSTLAGIQNMPAPVKAGAVLAGGGSLLSALYFVLGSRVFPIVLIGLVVVGLLLVLYKMILKAMEKRKANPFAKGLSENSGAAPQGISEPAKRARLDDLRKNFEAGVEKFRAAGKNLYSTPWYMLVGEPGSGKTEAIRHCNVGFPPGLQDQLQGAGGTLNMNWWFTNHAIVLDTAGRLMFEEAPPGQTTEWQEFLRLLRQSRPNCPINGMLLVIPADSLIRDTADQIEKKAGKIAQQLDSIQRTLGVRFPAFVVITKCDLINGFREFFDNLDDPQLQHQMLGWSNPEDLDQPFRPEQVEQHLSQVRERMIRRRTLMLQDPVHTENPSSGRRIDQVDALYAFPDSLVQIAPRLRRYLEMIFVAGEWSAKPLFLRGIYFTSSMREGSALDAELAEALGVSVESLPEGRVWERDRAYFLRDLFMSKVFKEKGLVTRAGNVRATQRRRRAMVMGAGFTTVALLLVLTVYGALVFRDSVGTELDFWRSAAKQVEQGPAELEILRPALAGSLDYQFRGDATLEQVLERPTIAALHPRAAKLVERPPGVPRIFRLVASMSGDLESMRRDGAAAMFEASVLRPLLEATGRKLGAETAETWSPAATRALAQLVRVESIAAGRLEGTGGAYVDLDALFRYALPEAGGYDGATATEMKGVVEMLYPAAARRQSALAVLGRSGSSARTGIERGGERFIEYWAAQGEGRAGRLAGVSELRRALLAYEQAEVRAHRVDEGFAAGAEPETLAAHSAVVARWAEAHGTLVTAHADLDRAVKQLGAELDQPVERLCDGAAAELLTRARAEYDLVRGQIAAAPAAPAEGEGQVEGQGQSAAATPLAEALGKGWTDLEVSTRDLSNSLRQDIGKLYSAYLDRAAGSERRQFAIRHEMYTIAQERLGGSGDAVPQAFGDIAVGLAAWNQRTQEALTQLGSLTALGAGSPLAGDAGRVSRFLVSVADRHAAYIAADRILSTAPASSAEFAVKVGELAQSAGYDQWVRPTLPMTKMDGGAFDIRFHPQAAERALSQWAILMRSLAAPGAAGATVPRVLEAAALRDRSADARRVYEQYLGEYVEYWSRTVPEVEAAVVDAEWAEFLAGLRALRPFHVNGEVRRLLERVQAALAAVPADLASGAAVSSARTRIEREMSELANPRLDDVCRVVRDRWTALGDDHALARNEVLRLPREQFESEYLEIYAEGDAGVRYWNDLLVATLRVLANASQREARLAISTLMEGYDAFPVCIGAGERVLDEQAVAQLGTLAAKVGQIGPAAPAAPGRGQTIGAGARTASERINEQLVRLTGEDLFRTTAEREWIRRVRAVAAFLHGAPQMCEIVILNPAEQDRVPQAGLRTATTIYSLIEFQAGEAGNFETFSTRDVARGPTPRVSLPGASLSVRFRKTSLDEPEQPLVFAGPWNVVAMAQMPGSVVEPVEGGGSLVKVPLVFADGSGQRFYYWIGVKFERSAPALADWPTREMWPGR